MTAMIAVPQNAKSIQKLHEAERVAQQPAHAGEGAEL
jgi:hypothetical protein